MEPLLVLVQTYKHQVMRFWLQPQSPKKSVVVSPAYNVAIVEYGYIAL
jgi:hypothetical protein